MIYNALASNLDHHFDYFQVVLGTISSVNDAIEWLKYTYLYVRMKKNPLCYGVSMQMLKVQSLINIIFHYCEQC